ncbi:hypothetical protein BCR33DRAFT_737849 [Rhizoclosmatium globosum]|uniref:Uncharacterized protein n=1 Tax=Rhizoclosmatium globosum TaxID=329046 RepID=A0A1Y2CCT7_9FUNG|nr:hypothetical protein BCR33DRAFT_737849 [Rhizoclosmatium globosum]|eukprot:ORY44860.1 hypothetical protein BCR33DRAFT_737849 [Rhizoclosmatium globosum]
MKNFNTQFQRFTLILVQENVIRSVLIVAVNSAMLYASENVTDPYLSSLFYVTQTWIYTMSLNAELFWIDVRNAIHHEELKRFMTPNKIPEKKARPSEQTSRNNLALSVVTMTDRISKV